MRARTPHRAKTPDHKMLRDILPYYTGSQTPNLPAVPAVVEKIFGYLDMDALTQARRVSKEWRAFVDSLWPLWTPFWAARDGRLDIVERMIEYGKPKDFTLLQALEGAVLIPTLSNASFLSWTGHTLSNLWASINVASCTMLPLEHG